MLDIARRLITPSARSDVPPFMVMDVMAAAARIEAQGGRVIHMERTLLLQKVQRAGIQVLDWDVSEPFDLVVKRKLSRPPAWLRAVGR